jgi:hypothetical protein
LHYKAIRKYLINHYDAYLVNGEEVDDKLGYTQGMDTIICTGDKDLDCIPGLHFNWSPKSVDKGVYNLSTVEADRFFFTQCLIGDSSDNIPGLKKIKGRNATKKIKLPIQTMDDPLDMYNYIQSVYGDDSWHPSAGCLWIRREPYQTWEGWMDEVRGVQSTTEESDNGGTEESVVEESEEKDNP